MKRVVVMIGIPGSGKTTVVKKLMEFMRLNHVGSDLLLPVNEAGCRIYNKDTLRNSWLEVWRKFGNSLLAGENVILDATFTTVERRSHVIGIAQGMGFKVTGVFLNTGIAASLIRNGLRPDRVPEKIVLRMAAALEDPKVEEGWDHLWRMEENGSIVDCIQGRPRDEFFYSALLKTSNFIGQRSLT